MLKLGNGLRRFPVDKAIGFSNTYPLDSALFESSTYFVKLTRALLVILCDTVYCLGAGVIGTTHISPHVKRIIITVEPRSTDTRLIRTPALYGQFRLSRQKAHIFSLKLTRFIPGHRLIRTTDTFLCPES